MKKLLVFYILLIPFTGCIPKPCIININNSILAIQIKIIPPAGDPSYTPRSTPKHVIFVKLNDEKDYTNPQKIIFSNYYTKFGNYYLNVEDGTYVAIGAHYPRYHYKKVNDFSKSGDTFLLFPHEMVKKTEIKIQSGKISYMGSYTIHQTASATFKSIFSLSPHLKDSTQKFYHNLLYNYPERFINFSVKRETFIHVNMDGFHNDYNRFIYKQRKYFKGTSWETLFSEK